VTGSPHLSGWLAEQGVSLAFTTYQTGKIFFLGHRPDGGLAVFERNFSRAMGLWADGQTLWLSTLYQLWRFENILRPGETHQVPATVFRLRALFIGEEKFPVERLVGLRLAAWTCRPSGTPRARMRRSGRKAYSDFVTADEGSLRRYLFDANVRD
jgi:hypothetical protein